MDTENPRDSNNDIVSLPFFNKYGHYILASIIVAAMLNVLLKSWRTGEQYAKKDAKEPQELRPDEEFNDYTDSNEENQDVPYLPRDLEHVKFEYTRPKLDEISRRSEEFYKIADSRRTLRFFSSDPIPREIIRNIVRAAGTSPSGAHTEPWTFVAISDPTVKQEIREIVEREEEVNYNKRMGIKWTTDLQPLRTDWRKEYLTEAPYLLLVFKQDYGVLPSGKRKIHYYKEMSVAIACGILITAIQYAGLVTLTSTPLNCGPALRVLLNRPVNEKLVLLLPVGYPAEDATVPNLKRKPLDEILVEFE